MSDVLVHVLGPDGLPVCEEEREMPYTQLASDQRQFPLNSKSCDACLVTMMGMVPGYNTRLGWLIEDDAPPEPTNIAHLADAEGFRLCDSTRKWEPFSEGTPGYLCIDCASIATEQHGGPAFGGEEPPNRFITPEQQAILDAGKDLWDEHTTDCMPGLVGAFGEAISRDEQFVKDVYQWFATSLMEMTVATGWDPAEVTRVIQFITHTAMYFHTGECFVCTEVVNEEVNRVYQTERSTVRSEGDQPVPGEGEGADGGPDADGGRVDDVMF